MFDQVEAAIKVLNLFNILLAILLVLRGGRNRNLHINIDN